MKNRKRMRRCLSLLLAGALSMSGGADIRANGEVEADENAYLTESANDSESENSWGEVEEVDAEEPIEQIISENTVSDDVLSENTESHQENGNEPEPVVSDNILSADVLLQDEVNDVAEVEESDPIEEENDERPVEVVLPSSISINMVTFGDEKLEGMIKSEQFCIENTGYEDVKISVQGICSGEKGSDLVIASSSTIDGAVPGKKSAWIYLQWEDEKREILDHPKLILGDESGSESKGEILLRAPKRDQNGEITGEDNASKIYFSFAGDMRSDTGEIWEDSELKLRLLFFVEKINVSDPNLPEQISSLE